MCCFFLTPFVLYVVMIDYYGFVTLVGFLVAKILHWVLGCSGDAHHRALKESEVESKHHWGNQTAEKKQKEKGCIQERPSYVAEMATQDRDTTSIKIDDHCQRSTLEREFG